MSDIVERTVQAAIEARLDRINLTKTREYDRLASLLRERIAAADALADTATVYTDASALARYRAAVEACDQ